MIQLNLFTKHFFILLVLVSITVMAGCSPKTQTRSVVQSPDEPLQPQSWIDAPLNESHIPLAPYQIVFHVSGEPDVAVGELTINEQIIALLDVEETGTKLATLKYNWEPREPGKYVIHTRARTLNGEWGPFENAVVYVDSGETPTLTPPPKADEPSDISDIQTSPDQVYIGKCQPNQLTISAYAAAPAGIRSVSIFYRFSDSSGNLTGWSSEAMAGISDGKYQKVIDMTSAAQKLGFSGQKGSFIYQIIIEDKNKDLIRGEVLRDVFVARCEGFLPLLSTKKPDIPLIFVTPTVQIIK